jgi:phosphoribosylamine--glycine ligase
MALLDGKSLLMLPLSRDHKRLKDNDEGPNTGGMGAFAPAWIPKATKKSIRKIFNQVSSALQKEGLGYRGVLYCGLMLTKSGPKVLEFNCRFGDPEAQAVLPLIQSDCLEMLWFCAQGKLKGRRLKLFEGTAVCVTLACDGYPDQFPVGEPIQGLDKAEEAALVFHSGTIYEKGVWKTSGGRVLGVTGFAPNIELARDFAYEAISQISFSGMIFRSDIAKGE